MSLRTYLDSFAQADYSKSGLTFDPKAVLFFLNELTADGSGQEDPSCCIGAMASDTDWRCIAAKMEHNSAGRSEVGVMQEGTNAVCMVEAITGAAPATGDLLMEGTATLDAGGYSVNITTDDGVARVISALAIGHDDVKNAKTGVFTVDSAETNPVSVTGLGFTPTVVIFYGSAHYDTDPFRLEYNAYLTFGCMCADGSQWSTSLFAPDFQFLPLSSRYQKTSSCFAQTNDSGSVLELSYSSMDADGFTVLTNGGSDLDNTQINYIAIKGGAWHAGSFNTKTSTGSQSTTGMGFQPVGIILATASGPTSSSVATHAFQSIGCGLSASSRMTRFFGAKYESVLCYRSLRRDNVLTCYRINAVGGFTNSELADLTSLDGDGFTLNYSVATATAKEVLYLGFGDKPTVKLLGKSALVGKTAFAKV